METKQNSTFRRDRGMSKKVSINNFASEVTKITREYLDEVEDGTNKAIMETAFDARDELKVAGDFKDGKKRKERTQVIWT